MDALPGSTLTVWQLSVSTVFTAVKLVSGSAETRRSSTAVWFTMQTIATDMETRMAFIHRRARKPKMEMLNRVVHHHDPARKGYDKSKLL